MSLDDGISAEELRGYILHEAHLHYSALSGAAATDDEDEASTTAAAERLSLSARAIARLSRALCDTLMQQDLADLEGDKLNGEQLYDVTKLNHRIQSLIQPVLEAQKQQAVLETPEKPVDQRYQVDIFTSRGRRLKMEDRHAAFADFNALMGLSDYPPQAFFAVYDGHGGNEAARFTQAQLHCNVVAQPTFREDPQKALVDGFIETDKQFLRKAERDALSCGATACTVLIRGRKMYVSWLGDSQVIMCKSGQVVELMKPHKPEREDEKLRINDAGGVVVWYGAWRVNGVLSVARAIGDKKLKQWVIGTPDTAVFDLDEQCEYLILACDGLWDTMTQDKIVTFIREWRDTHDSVTGVARSLVEHCIGNLLGTDNISIVIVFLRNLQADSWEKAV